MDHAKRIYLDNAATSSPKPPAVLRAMIRYATELGGSPGRGAYRESVEAAKLLNQCRARISRLIGGENEKHVVFTLNCSDALNIAIKGVVRPGDHVITTCLDHNSVLRPLNKLAHDGIIEQTRLPCDSRTGVADPDELRKAIRPHTRLIAAVHGSNVTGALQPIAEYGRMAREHGVCYLVDAAQTLGHVPLDVRAANIDLLAAPGHKGLLGPLGTGFLYIRPGIEKTMTTLREGGTGSVSERDVQPDFMPDRFEPGSHNTIGLIGLSEGVQYLLETGMREVRKHDIEVMQAFMASLDGAESVGLKLYGTRHAENRCAVFSLRLEGFDRPQDLSDVLEREYGLLTRSGLHCAPGAHEAIGTAQLGGTTRLSFGAFNTVDDAKFASRALLEVSQQGLAAARR